MAKQPRIDREDVLMALGYIAAGGDTGDYREAHDYFLPHKGRIFSSKMVLAIATAIHSGGLKDILSYLPPCSEIDGGSQVKRILESLGFAVTSLSGSDLDEAISDLLKKRGII